MRHSLILSASILLGMSASAMAEEPAGASAPATVRLTVGEPAPPLSVEKWVRGESVPSFEKGRVYVVEFWATWCGPCIRSMPHLADLSKQHPEVTFIASTKPDKRNTLEKVEAMVKDKNAEGLMQCTVAWDGAKATYEAYMGGAKQRGIPCAFVVDKESRVAFIGHPMDLDAALAGVTSGTWDLAQAKAKYEAEFVAEDRRNTFFEAMDAGDTRKAYALADSLINEYFKDDAGTLNGIAWTIVDPAGEVKDKDLNIAMRAAERAATLEPKESGILDTLARVQFLKGDIEAAIKTQQAAIDNAKDEAMRAELAKALEEYTARR